MPVLGKTKHEVVSQFRSAEILEAARQVFAKKGFNDATVDEIAETAGLAKGTVYLYFPSKREIYLEALKSGFARLAEKVQAEVGAAPDLRSKIRAFVHTRLAYVEQDRDFFKIYHSEFGKMTYPASLNREFCDLYRRQLNALETTLRAASDSGEMRRVPVEAAAFALYEVTRGFMLRRILGWSQASLEEDVDSICEIVWRGIGAA